jgi:hypothetical protein
MTGIEGGQPQNPLENHHVLMKFEGIHHPIEMNRSEMVGRTEISGFNMPELTNQNMAEYGRLKIPPSHLEGCTAIRYEPNHPYFVKEPNVQGFYIPSTGQITIGPAERSQLQEYKTVGMAEGVQWTTSHEIGHNVFRQRLEQRSPHLVDTWKNIHEQSKTQFLQTGRGFVTDYSHKNYQEDFAESYMVYIHDPQRLQFHSTPKYNFLRNYVFSGREYGHV